MRRPAHPVPDESAESAAFDQHLGEARKALPLGGPVPALSAQRSALRTFGGQFGPFGQAAATALQKGGDIYSALPPSAHALPAAVERLRRLEHARGEVLAFLTDINGQIAGARVDIAEGVELVEATTGAVLQNPTTPGETRKRAEAASTDLRGLRQGQKGRRKATLARTRALKTGFTTTQVETLDRNAALEADLAKARLEIQYLSGERLRPSDLGAPAAPVAAKVRRRQPR